MLFNQWLREQMEEQGITQNDVSVLSGLSEQMVASLCQGRRLPSFMSAINLCAALEVSLQEAAVCEEFTMGTRSEMYHQKKGKVSRAKGKKSAVQKSAVHKPATGTARRKKQGPHSHRTTVRTVSGDDAGQAGLAGNPVLAGRSTIPAAASDGEGVSATGD